jgi:hypothetical protein
MPEVVPVMPNNSASSTRDAAIAPALCRRTSFASRYVALAGRAETGSFSRWCRTSAASALAVS